MDVVILAANLLALVIGTRMVGMAYNLTRNYNLSYLNNYLYYLVFAVLAGFFDWIVYNIISSFVPVLQSSQRHAVYAVFWNLIGFPCLLFSAYFLITTLSSLLNLKPNRRRKRTIVIVISVISLLSLAHALLRAGGIYTSLGTILWNIYLYVLPVTYTTLFIFAFFFSRKNSLSDSRFIQRFIFLLFIGNSTWFIISLIFGRTHPYYHFIIFWFYIAFVPPTIYLRRHLVSNQNIEVLKGLTKERLNHFFNNYNFTEKEKDLIVLMVKGKSYKAMSEELFVSQQTVKNYASRIYKKANLKNRIELVNLVLK